VCCRVLACRQDHYDCKSERKDVVPAMSLLSVKGMVDAAPGRGASCCRGFSLPLPRKKKAPSVVGRGPRFGTQRSRFQSQAQARGGLCRVCQLYRPGRGPSLRKRRGA
jgi:hypothetical protein